jgi:hypothetical protein
MPFNLDDYVPVAERLAAFYAEYPKGSIQSDIIELSDKRVVMRATVYRDPADERPSIAHSALGIPGTTQFTRGSEIENAETSAIGRAIAMLGFEVKRGVASREEVRNKQDDEPKVYRNNPDKPRGSGLVSDTPFKEDEGGLIGTVEVGKARDSDFELRETPDGWALGFKLKSNGGGFKVLTRDELALQLLDVKDEVVGKRVTVYGRVRDETFTPNKPNARTITYQVIDALRIKTEAGTLPVAIGKQQHIDAVTHLVDADEPIPVAEGQEALFDPLESARLDAEEVAAASAPRGGVDHDLSDTPSS